jgi:hypothetical protein
MTCSEPVHNLIERVARLSDEDQDLLLRIVRLLARAPESAQTHSKFMLQQLLSASPTSRLACLSGLEEIIGYLEDRIARDCSAAGHDQALPRRLV